MNYKKQITRHLERQAKSFKGNLKGQTAPIFGAIGAILALVVFGIVLSMAGLTQAKIGSQMTSGTIEYNATVQAREGVKVASDFQPTISTIVIIGVILTILIGSLGGLLLYVRNR